MNEKKKHCFLGIYSQTFTDEMIRCFGFTSKSSGVKGSYSLNKVGYELVIIEVQ